MATFAYPIPNGKVNSEGLTKLISTLYTGSGVVYSGSLTVSASGTPDMNVVVSGSQKDDVAVFIGDEGIAYTGWNTANATVAIDANGTGNTMKETIVAYIDLAAGDSETANAPDGLKFMALRGAATDTAPTDGAIDTAVGHSLWTRLADVTVASGATSINSGNITDVRTRAQVNQIADGAITTTKIADGSITTAKIASEAWTGLNFGSTTWFSSPSGMGVNPSSQTGRYKIIGKTLFFTFKMVFSPTGSGRQYIVSSNFPWPATPKSGVTFPFAAISAESAGVQPAAAYLSTNGNVYASPYDGAWTIMSNSEIVINGVVELE